MKWGGGRKGFVEEGKLLRNGWREWWKVRQRVVAEREVVSSE